MILFRSSTSPAAASGIKEIDALDDWKRLSSYPYYKERMNAMEILTHIIFVLNLLKSLINHFF